MTITEFRLAFKPFEYQQAEEFWKRTHMSHWVPWDTALGRDIANWHEDLTETERQVIGGVLKGFTQNETIIGDYWSTSVSRWFPKHEIVLMCRAFGDYESIHQVAYQYLSDSLGIDDFSAFMQDPAALAKYEYLADNRAESLEDIARSLAVFSAFSEGVSLFSSFGILMFFSSCGLMRGVGKIVEYSCRDESTHSEAGCWLFRQLLSEHPELNTTELKESVYEAARAVVDLEHSFIDSVFSLGELTRTGVNGETLNSQDLKEYIKWRANLKLQELGLDKIFETEDQAVNRIASWFHVYVGAAKQQDFFAGMETSYAKGAVQFDPNVMSFDF
ncbi:ribonucleotide-diphosphate reductase subunit beta [Leptolyngbya sp. AN03gr2]|uniref:ribonucleotide-diphosphate reductase subunit beta n=1 Tax=Leptolyngbya sp. AN03gr2 TaxID=3423364 RepID=UPI003D310E64